MGTTFGYDRMKRAMDVALATAGLVITAPVQIVVAGVVASSLGRPILFKQMRPGLNGRPFELFKFRTMLSIDPERGRVTNEERITRTGKALRSLSLDELPSLFNVLRGDLSLVGPRPLRMSYLPRYSRIHGRRHSVRPGLTGLAQVEGRNALGWNERLDLDVEYVDNMSFSLDVRILLRTIRVVLSRSGIAEEGTVAMSEFFGSGERLICRPLAVEDLSVRVEWLNHPNIRNGVSISFTADQESMKHWFDRVQLSVDRRDYVCVNTKSQIVSMFGLVEMTETRASLYVYVGPDFQGCGIGRLTLVHLLKEASDLSLDELNLEVKTENLPAIRLYENFGFKKIDVVDDGKKYVMRRSSKEADGA